MAIQLTRGACADAGMHTLLRAGVREMGTDTFCLPFSQRKDRNATQWCFKTGKKILTFSFWIKISYSPQVVTDMLVAKRTQ